MNKIICFLTLLIIGSCAYAYEYRPYETKQQEWERKSNENYDRYKNNNYQAPLGSYNQTLGSSTSGYQYGYNNQNNDRNNSVRGMNINANDW